MSSKPKAKYYAPSEQEKVLSEVSRAEKKYFDETYGPLLREMRDLSEKEELGAMARGTAQADTMTALTGRPSFQAVRSVDAAADLASAATSQQLQGSTQGLQAQRQRQLGVLGTARGQAADAMSGLAQAARIQTTKDLQAAQAKQQIRQARTNAFTQLATTFGLQGISNLAGGGSFFTPKAVQGGGQSRLQYAGQQLKNYFGLNTKPKNEVDEGVG